MNIPIGLAGLLVGALALPEAERKPAVAFDWAGFILVSLGISLLLVCASRLTHAEALANTWNLAGIALALGALAAFVRVELRKPDPLLNLRLFAVAPYSLSVLIVVAQAIGMFGCLFLIPLFMEAAGYSASLTGLALLVAAVSASLCAGLGGKLLDRCGPRLTVTAGLALTALANMAFGLGDSHLLVVIFVFMAIRGMGVGLSYMPVTTAGLNAIPDQWVTQGSAMNNILRRIGAALALVLVSVYYEWRSAQLLAGGATSANAAALASIHELFTALGLLLVITLPLALWLPAKAATMTDKTAPQYS
jgi:predicted MFS family arabinose efflux permease